MRPESLELESKSRTSVSQSILQKLRSSSPNGSGVAIAEEEFLGGVIRGGQLAWIAIGSNLEVLSLKTGQRVAGQTFDEKSSVTCVAEVTDSDIGSCLLIIAVQRVHVGGLLYLFSVQGSRIVHRINVLDKITSCCFVSDAACKRSCLGAFNGCAAVGTEAGEVFLIDLHLNRCKEIISRQKAFSPNTDESSCKIVAAPIDENEIRLQVNQTRVENINLGIRLDFSVVEQPSPISSILSMPQMQMIVVGLENGLLALFNLCNLNALHLAYPPEIDSPLVKLTFLEPADDPRPCVYIWAFHANKNNFPFAVMHSVSFISKTYQDGENIYETFQWCRPDLTIPIHERDSKPISCQSVTKIVSDEEDEQYSLCLLAWTNRMSSFVLVFDLNQWYKEQMPRVCDWRDYPSYLAPFPIEEAGDAPLDIWMNPKSVSTFNSIQRPEEHFYPISLSFDLIELKTTIVQKLHWDGLQNNAIKKLSNTGAVAILMPDECFHEFLEASLIPQLSDQNYHANPSKRIKQEFLLSMALEYNCMGLLRQCAQQWADGSHMGRGSSEGLTLSTLTDWIWNQATLIKDRCNDLCVSLFDDSGITIDLRSRKILAHYSRQLKLLAEILNMIITSYRQYIPDEIFDTLTAQRNSIRMTSEYQEVLQWLLNMGLLPEIVWNQLSLPESRNDTFTAIPYPYRILNKFYTDQRQRFYENDRSNIAPKTNSCKCLYIDSFIDRECNSHLLRTEWNNGLGDGLYPPPSLQAMLRILLIPGISLENKYMLFVYLFLDLHMVLESEHFNVVQNLIKFPAVFNLNSSLIKTTQAFWNLDHNEYEIALKELISPLTSDRLILKWQQELLVNTLLIRDMPNLALQALRAPGPSINTTLRIKTLLANNLITEAFELQRSKYDEKLLLEFFKGCHELKKWNYVLGLSLTEREGEVLCKFLNTCDSLLSENLQLIYLLQRNRYIEALMYLDELKHKPRTLTMHKKLENTQDMIISSYKLAMNSTNRKLCDQYMAIKSRLDVDAQQNCELTSPLSSQLNPYIVDSNANVVGSVFHRAIVAAKRTGFNSSSQKSHIPLLGNIRIEIDPEEFDDDHKPIHELKPYVGLLKRRKESSYEHSSDPDLKQPAAKRQRTDSFSVADLPLKRHAPGINSYLLTSLTNQSHVVKEQNMSIQELDDTIDIDNDQPRNSIGELCETVNLLSTPVVKSSRLEKQSRIDSRCQTPQSTRSILKQRHTEIGSTISRRSTSPSLTANSRRSVDFNAKPFCYTIPPQNDEFRLGAIEETANVQEDDDSNSFNSPNSIKGRRPIHSAKNSSASNSIDEFYSPETSKVNEELKETSHEIGNENLSRIPHHTETPVLDSPSTVKPRRGLRSKTPEIPMMSSTRITRSRSKLNLEDSAGYDSVTEQPVLNTSTPKRTAPKRASSRSLSKNVITSNALKVQTEVDKSIRVDGSEDSRSVDGGSAVKQRNFLKDASEMSMRTTSMAYSMDELDATHMKYNLLQDSSSFASECSESDIVEKLSVHEDSVTGQIDKSVEEQTREEIQEETQDETQEEIHEEAEEVQEKIEQQQIEPTEEQFKEQNETQTDEQSIADYSMESVENEPSSTHVAIDNESIPNDPSSIVNAQTTIEVTETTTEHVVITAARELAQNYLVDSSTGVSESILQKFSRYEHCTSSFFAESANAQNLLEDSSICTPPAIAESASNVDSEKDVVNLDDIDSKSEASSNNTISSEESSDSELEGNLVYEESDNEDDEPNAGPVDVIQIYSSSEDENNSVNSLDDIQIADSQDPEHHDEIEYDINDELTSGSQPQTNQFEQIDNYNIIELQSASIEVEDFIPPTETSAQSLISQEQAMNHMIYGDLGVVDAEMLDLDVHGDAFGFEMHGDHGDQNQESAYLEMATTRSEQVPQLILDEPTTSEPIQQQQDINDEQICEQTVNQDQPQEYIVDENVTTVNKSEAPVSETTESISIAQEQNIVVEALVEVPETDETNILDKAVIIDEPSTIESGDVTTEKQFDNIESEPMESTAMEVDEPTNIFDKAAAASTLDVSEPISEIVESSSQKEDTHTIDSDAKQVQSNDDAKKSPEKLTTNNDKVKQKSQLRRTGRAASQQDLSKDDDKDGEKERINVTDSKSKAPSKQKMKKAMSHQNLSIIDETEAKSNETIGKLRTKRAKSQQPIERSSDDVNRLKRSVSEHKEFSINIKRIETEAGKSKDNSENQQQTVDEAQPEDSKRKKRGASQQKDVPVKVKSEEEPSTSKAATSKRTKTKSNIDLDLGDKFDAEEKPIRRLRKATSNQNLTELVESQPDETTVKSGKLPSRKRTESTDFGDKLDAEEKPTRRLRKATSNQSLTELVESQPDEITAKSKSPSRKRTESTDLGDKFDAEEKLSRRLRKATSNQNLSELVGNQADETTVKSGKSSSRKRTESIDLGDKFDAEEKPIRRLRKATSNQSLSELVENQADEITAKKGKSTGPRRAQSHQSLSSISDEGQPEEDTKRRSKRTKSVSMQDISIQSTSRTTKRVASQQRLDDIDEKEELKVQKRKKTKSESTDSDSELGDKFDENESSTSRRLRKAVSHQTLSSIEERSEDSPIKKGKTQSKKELKTSRMTRRATSTQSITSAIEDEARDTEAPKTRSRKRIKSDSSDKVEENPETETKTRSRRAPSETKQSPKGDDKKESRKTSTRSSKKDDDTHSEASSIVSTRSRKTAANTDDETSSVKSSRVRGARSASVLPAIAEDENQATSTLSQDYLENSRLTRSQRATIEKYAKLKKKISVNETTSERKTRKAKADNTVEEQQLGSDHSDSESVTSHKSTASKVSKKSKTSEASSSQRTTRQRAQKK